MSRKWRRRRKVRPRFVLIAGIVIVILFVYHMTSARSTAASLSPSHATSPSTAKKSSHPTTVAGHWSTAPFTLPQPLEGIAAAPNGHTIYIAGGLNQTSTSTVYAITSSGVRLVANLPTTFHDAGAAVLNGTLYVMGGGQVSSQAQAWRMSLNPPGTIRTAPSLFSPLSDFTAVSFQGAIYLVGGHGAGAPSNRVWKYVPNGQDTVFATLPHGVRYAAVASNGRQIFVAGGLTATGATSAAAEVDLKTGAVTRLPNLPYAVQYAAGAVINGRFMVAGGEGTGGFTRRVEIYRPHHHVWQAGPALPAAAGDGALAPLGPGALWIGGQNGQRPLNSIWQYHP